MILQAIKYLASRLEYKEGNKLRIGFVSTWFERGAAYVTKSYINALSKNNEIFVYARGGERFAKGDPEWDLPYVTWGYKLTNTRIDLKHFKKWLNSNEIEIVFFNEQNDFEILYYIKTFFPKIKIGAYIDYYKEDMIDEFNIYDFLICNTKRHYSVFKDHPQCYYIPWGVNTDVFRPINKLDNSQLTFFHSVGMSLRKGTSILLETYIEKELYKSSKLVIHSQLDFEKAFGYSINDLKNYNIELYEKTVTAPGLYHLGDVYVYPTTLDGLGLTLYEALSCGLPVITTNNAPMNEVISNNIGYLVDVKKYYSRSNGYYWPLSICNEVSLYEGMLYYINNREKISDFKNLAREYALKNYNWNDRVDEINYVFESTNIQNSALNYSLKLNEIKKRRIKSFLRSVIRVLPNRVEHIINNLVK